MKLCSLTRLVAKGHGTCADGVPKAVRGYSWVDLSSLRLAVSAAEIWSPLTRTSILAPRRSWLGAICVAHPRIPENITLDELSRRYPGLAPRLGPEKCTEDAAMADPAALTFNRSEE
jgi:hypothetical protein